MNGASERRKPTHRPKSTGLAPVLLEEGFGLLHVLPFDEEPGARATRFLVKPHHVERAEGFFHKHGGKTVLFGRWVGFLRSLAPFIAGSARMPYGRFVAFDVVGAVSWGAVVVLLGYGLGSSYHLAERWLGRISLFLLIFVVAGALFFVLGRWLWARKERLGRLSPPSLPTGSWTGESAGCSLGTTAEDENRGLSNGSRPGGRTA